MKNEAGLRPMKRAFGTRKTSRALRFTATKLLLHTSRKACASYSRSDFIHRRWISSANGGFSWKKHLLAQVLFSGRGSWIRTSEWGSQSPLPYRLAIPLYNRCHQNDLKYFNIKSGLCQYLMKKFFVWFHFLVSIGWFWRNIHRYISDLLIFIL